MKCAIWKFLKKLDRTSLEEAKSIEWIEESPFVIGADGAQSAVRSAMEEDKYGGFYVKKYDDKNVRQLSIWFQNWSPSTNVKNSNVDFEVYDRIGISEHMKSLEESTCHFLNIASFLITLLSDWQLMMEFMNIYHALTISLIYISNSIG